MKFTRACRLDYDGDGFIERTIITKKGAYPNEKSLVTDGWLAGRFIRCNFRLQLVGGRQCRRGDTGSAESKEAAQENNGEKKLVRYVMPGTAPQDQKAGEAAINKKLEEDGLNLQYEAIYISWDVWDQKTNLMMSTGEELELIHIMQDNKGPNVLASNGGIIQIDEYLDEYGPELKKSLPDWIWDTVKILGKIYSVPNYWLDSAYADGMVTVRQDLLEQNGLQRRNRPTIC
ncbi:extracellular solute-binding protein [Cohnella sp. SGD-V74]|nr:extracellular solute-binding protein [Cohnella sp. SGD-V74]